MENKETYVLCLENRGYTASLEKRKVYRLLEDEIASSAGRLRVIDESGEDYLYPASYFIALELPVSAREAFALTS